MLGKSKGNAGNYDQDASSVQRMPPSPVASPAEISSISAGLSIIGKIVGHGAVTIFWSRRGRSLSRLYGCDCRRRTDGGRDRRRGIDNLAARSKVLLHANRVQLNSTAVVEGDIFHRTPGN